MAGYNQEFVEVNEQVDLFRDAVHRLSNKEGAKRLIISHADLVTRVENVVGHVNELEEKSCLPGGGKVWIKDYVVISSDGSYFVDIDLHFRPTYPKANREAILIGELTSFEHLHNGQLVVADDTYAKTYFQAERVFVVVRVCDHFMDMSNYNILQDQTLTTGVLSESEQGNKRIYVLAGESDAMYSNYSKRYRKISILAANLIVGIHSINRRPTTYEEFIMHIYLGYWPFDSDRFVKYAIDKAIEIVGRGSLAGNHGTRLVGRRRKVFGTQRQVTVEFFDRAAADLRYRMDEVSTLKVLGPGVIQQLYGIA